MVYWFNTDVDDFDARLAEDDPLRGITLTRGRYEFVTNDGPEYRYRYFVHFYDVNRNFQAYGGRNTIWVDARWASTRQLRPIPVEEAEDIFGFAEGTTVDVRGHTGFYTAVIVEEAALDGSILVHPVFSQKIIRTHVSRIRRHRSFSWEAAAAGLDPWWLA